MQFFYDIGIWDNLTCFFVMIIASLADESVLNHTIQTCTNLFAFVFVINTHWLVVHLLKITTIDNQPIITPPLLLEKTSFFYSSFTPNYPAAVSHRFS